ncbi:DoxX family protein [Teredinibacter sp. KSP-S5-2]|uniref:DoxX family protein n=1 Tax=Teredinibacter sp. KSP-S5-2 TaxID=3034506 RepID=UPI002934458E|nr:DoxX family protein [Teredinibacter sp. KSP-S5-2]WNO09751.1 DoxX family protein [Teredinibacter sp. KSP-S5-2]
MTFLKKIDSFARHLGGLCPEWVISITFRISLFLVFWQSAQKKISGIEFLGQDWAFWNVTDRTIALFQYSYNIPLIPPEITAYIATFAEFFLSITILLGFMTRMSALCLLIMLAIIQFVVLFPNGDWQTHLLWAGMMVYLLKNGSGSLSLDNLIRS